MSNICQEKKKTSFELLTVNLSGEQHKRPVFPVLLL